ncbi:MAG: aspartate aminotransferase family protein [Desulfovibrionaceae bacterium]
MTVPFRPRPDRTEGDVNQGPARAAWTRDHVGPRGAALTARDADVYLRQSLSTPCLTALARAEGAWIEDVDGRRYLDFHGNSVHQLGHAHPRVVAAVKAQLDALAFCPRRYTSEPAVELAEALGGLAFGGRGKVLLAPAGTVAMGMALKLARLATGRFKTLSFWDAFHGAGLDALSVGGERGFREGLGPLLPGAEHLPPPEPYRCALQEDGNCPECDLACARYLEYVLERQGDVAAVVAEPVRCTTAHLPPEGYWPAVRAACDKAGALLIFDETATCLGRTGRMFAFEHFDAEPDLVVLGKGLGGGIMPLAALLARPGLDVAGHTSIGHYTHEKSPVGCAAALAALAVLAGEDLPGRARRLGRAALWRLEGLKARHACVGDVRGLGLMLAVELVKSRVTREPDPERAEAVLYACLARGLSFKVSQGNVLTLTPPLTIPEAELEQALDILDAALAETAQPRTSGPAAGA